MKNTFKTVKELEDSINSLFSSEDGELLIKFYIERFCLPKHVISQYLKQRLASNFNMKNLEYSRSVGLSHLFTSIIKYIGYVFVTLFYSKKINQNSVSTYKLLIDDIQSGNELSRWNRLVSRFERNQSIFIARADNFEISEEANILFRPSLKKYDRNILCSEILRFLFKDILILTWKSFKLRKNLIHIHTFLINDYLYYSSIFRNTKALFLIQDRNLGRTNALKNYLFKKFGGIATSCVQKNILQHNAFGLFYDIDIFFSYGEKTAEDILDLGGRIECVYPVGSFAMESSLKLEKDASMEKSSKVEKIDILYIGINAITSNKTNWDGYYESIRWLSKISKIADFNRILIKHHPSWSYDKKEAEIIKDTNIEYYDKDADSYLIASRSNLIVTYGSSMGYELMGYGAKVIFLDPNNSNQFINNFVHDDKNVIYEYERFESLALNPNKPINAGDAIKPSDYCLQNDDISLAIYEKLLSLS